jgi:ABC-type transport system involved in multi-copper enzyme maturation permease subunit
MFRAMAMKEWREARKVVLIALAVYALMGISFASEVRSLDPFSYSPFGFRYSAVPFVDDQHVNNFYCVAAGMAVWLGLLQTVGESTRGTYLFLLHRPASRRWLLAVKLLVGTALCLAVSAIPLAIYALWAATPGTHASPFEWSMTVPTCVGWFAMPLLYYGAFLSGIRPGRWSRSRLLPLAAAGVMLFVGVQIACEIAQPLCVCLIVAAVDVWMIAAVLWTVRMRDYA